MHVTFDIPQQASGLDAAIAKQFADIQRQLMELSNGAASSTSKTRTAMLEGMAEQQDIFLKAMESLISSLAHAAPRVSPKPATVAVTPRVTVSLPDAVTKQLDALETALVNKPRGFSHRTFGSNY